MRVVRVSEKLESKGRPSGLNTVNLLKVGNLGFLPILYLGFQFIERYLDFWLCFWYTKRKQIVLDRFPH